MSVFRSPILCLLAWSTPPPSAAPKPGVPLGGQRCWASPVASGEWSQEKDLSMESVNWRSGAVSCKRSVWLRPGHCDAGTDRERQTACKPARRKHLWGSNKQCSDLPCQNLARRVEIMQLSVSLTRAASWLGTSNHDTKALQISTSCANAKSGERGRALARSLTISQDQAARNNHILDLIVAAK
ncbi:hypothetical protein CTAM01_00546 [Colletotrichum tamarilloi]|uniref:Uncharacterized protein n=1 Tax=Colletotrichum tamarilloi TaxID=1209934 RepID=A0ABQ9RVJ8_9PEZI|nr:uncharacterized protein CTAM01_00546 [Colletotrichum tamarilloi]KAK1513150.1 hypothetical protein CTAM01_00546 [Colletotrichum tamarilloi]